MTHITTIFVPQTKSRHTLDRSSCELWTYSSSATCRPTVAQWAREFTEPLQVWSIASTWQKHVAINKFRADVWFPMSECSGGPDQILQTLRVQF